jgi:hypothetical protein
LVLQTRREIVRPVRATYRRGEKRCNCKAKQERADKMEEEKKEGEVVRRGKE